MEVKTIKAKILELANGNPDFPSQFGEMCIRDLKAFPKNAADAFKERDLRRLTHAIHQMKTIIGLFDLKQLDSYLTNPPELFEASIEEKKEFILKVQKEANRVADLIRKSIQPA